MKHEADFAETGAFKVLSVKLADVALADGIAVEVYPEAAKLKKQFEFAERKGIPFISINGSNEIAAKQVNIKNLGSGEQKAFPADDLKSILEFLQ